MSHKWHLKLCDENVSFSSEWGKSKTVCLLLFTLEGVIGLWVSANQPVVFLKWILVFEQCSICLDC